LESRPEATEARVDPRLPAGASISAKSRFGESTGNFVGDKRETHFVCAVPRVSNSMLIVPGTRCSSNSGIETREGVDPNGSLGGVHLSFYHPTRSASVFEFFSIDFLNTDSLDIDSINSDDVRPTSRSYLPNHDYPANRPSSACSSQQAGNRSARYPHMPA
jgi:hypothetical protein